MLGRLVWTGEWRPYIALREEQICGLTILRAELPGREDAHRAAARWSKGVRRLERAGVRRLVELGQQPPGAGVEWVSTRLLWQQMAASLAVTAIHSAGGRPERAVVALHSERVTQPVFQTCCRLMGAVRALSLTVPTGGEELTWWLERQYGVPVLSDGGDVTLCFSPEQGGGDRFLLGEEQPEPRGFTIGLKEDCEAVLPRDCPTVPLLAALLEEDRVRLEQMRVEREKCPEKGN